MPSVPIEMPSLTVIVPNVCGIVPPFRSADTARSASRLSPELHGVIVLLALATPTMGLVKWASRQHQAGRLERVGARYRLSVDGGVMTSIIDDVHIPHYIRSVA